MDVYRTMCEYLEASGWYRRSTDEGGWWDRDEDYGDMQIGDAVAEQLVADGLDLRNPPAPDEDAIAKQRDSRLDLAKKFLADVPPPHPDDNLF